VARWQQSVGSTVYLNGGLWEEDAGGEKRAFYAFNGTVVALRNGSSTPVYLHGDHLGSVSLTTTSSGTASTVQRFDPWGKVRAGSLATTTALNYTGQRLDSTGLLYYNARYYDPSLARFVSADSIVAGTGVGSGGAAATLGYDEQTALRPLTVDFHETGFVAALNGETAFTIAQGFAFQLSSQARKQAKNSFGPANPQALNRYSYVLNNPLRYTDPTGHVVPCSYDSTFSFCAVYRAIVELTRKFIAQVAWELGAQAVYTGADGITRSIRSIIKTEGPSAILAESRKLGQAQSQEINQLLKQFLDGNPNPGIGTRRLPGTNIFYLRGKDGGRVFLRQVDINKYEILAYSDKKNEQRVINLLLEYYGR